MKITATKIKLELVDKYGWASETLESNANKKLVNVKSIGEVPPVQT